MNKVLKNAAGMLIVPAIAVTASLALGVDAVSAQSAIQEGVNASQGTGVPEELFGDGSIFTIIVNILLFIIGAISVIMLIIGGIRYTVSGGDAAAVTGAKNTILYAIIGLVVAFLAFAVVNWVLGSLTTGA
jgi:Type IV secretion system pilin